MSSHMHLFYMDMSIDFLLFIPYSIFCYLYWKYCEKLQGTELKVVVEVIEWESLE